jgi:hypothetical protein
MPRGPKKRQPLNFKEEEILYEIHPEEFVPTIEQEQTVRLLKAANYLEKYIRAVIINPKTGKPVSNATFRKHFSEAMEDAKASINHKAISVLYAGVSATKIVDGREVPDQDMRYKCAIKVLQLCSKGLYEPKYEIPKDASHSQELDAAQNALRHGLISTFESDSIVNAIKAKIDSEKEDDKSAGIQITISKDTAEVFGGVIKDVIESLDDE